MMNIFPSTLSLVKSIETIETNRFNRPTIETNRFNYTQLSWALFIADPVSIGEKVPSKDVGVMSKQVGLISK